jgi:hypothetical protein
MHSIFNNSAAFPSYYDCNQFYLLGQLAGRLGYFPFPDMREFDRQIADEIRQWAEGPRCADCGVILHQGMPHHFGCQPFGDRIPDHLPPAME